MMNIDEVRKWHLPEDAGVVTRSVMAVRALWAVAQDPGHVLAGPAFALSADRPVFAHRAAQLTTTEAGRALLRERAPVLRGPSDLPMLRSMPEGSLGHELALYYDRCGITPFESTFPVHNDVEYLARRYRELHDVAHVLTGYGIDHAGELALQAFVLGNVGLRQTWLVLTLGPLARPGEVPPPWKWLAKARAAYARGRRSEDISIGARVQDYWPLPLEEARRELGVAAA